MEMQVTRAQKELILLHRLVIDRSEDNINFFQDFLKNLGRNLHNNNNLFIVQISNTVQ